MSDVSSQKSIGEDSNPIFTGEVNDEKKAEDSWTDVSLNDDSETIVKKIEDKGKRYFDLSIYNSRLSLILMVCI